MNIWWVLCVVVVLMMVRLHTVLPGPRASKPAASKRTTPAKTMIVLGSGGHTAEMFRLLRGLDSKQYSPRIYVVAETDKHSVFKLKEFEGENKDWLVEYIPRSREVGQSYITSIFSTLYALIFSLVLVVKTRPDLMICNGPGTCVPLCASNMVVRYLGKKSSIVYVESICRVEDLSLSAKLLYLFIDRLFVQWEQIAHKYPKAEYIGLLSH